MTLWISLVCLVSSLYGWFVIKKYIDEVNQIKHILNILPVSVVKTLPHASKYMR